MFVSVTAPAPAPAPKAAPVKGRDRYLDTLRALAIFRVVTYHAFGFAWFPWLPAMGVMFALGGTLMVRSVDKSAKQAVTSRFRRLLPVLWVFGAIWIPLMIWHDGMPSEWTDIEGEPISPWQLVFWLLPAGDPVGSLWGEIAWGVLWYLKTYLWFVALSPLLLKAFRKAPWPVLASPFLLLGLAELGILPLADWWGSTLNDVLVYLGCWLIGFAHAEGIIKRLPLPALFAIGGTVAAAGVVWLLGPASEQLAEAGQSSWFLEGSSLSLALYSFGVVFILMRYSSRMEWLNRHAVIDRIITIFNSRAVTIYLWHNAALVLAMDLTDRVGLYPWYVWFPLTWVLIGIAVLMFGWIEDVAARRKPELLPGKRKKPAPAGSDGATAPTEQTTPLDGRYRPPQVPEPNPVGGWPGGQQGPYGSAAPYGQDPRFAQDPRYPGAQYQDARHQDAQYQGAQYRDAQYRDPRDRGVPYQGDPYQDAGQPNPHRYDPRYQDARHQDPRRPDGRRYEGGQQYGGPPVPDPRVGGRGQQGQPFPDQRFPSQQYDGARPPGPGPGPTRHRAGPSADGAYDPRQANRPHPRPASWDEHPDPDDYPDRGRYPARQ